MKSKIMIAVVILAAFGLAGWFFLRGKKQGETVQYYTAAVSRGDITNSISATGTVEPEELINVGTQVGGMITLFGKDIDGKTVDYGSRVKKGTVLAKIDDTLYLAAVKQAEAQLEQQKSALERAKADLVQLKSKVNLTERELNRAKRLLPKGAMAQSSYDSALSAYQVASANIKVGEAEILQAQASLQHAKAVLSKEKSNLSYCTITSPVDGVIIDRRVNIGQTVVSSYSTPSLFLLAKDLRKMQVWVSVNEADIGRITKGMPVEFTVDAFPGEMFKGTVGKIRYNASLTQNVVTYIVEVQADNSNLRLLPYLTANTKFIVKREKDVLTVPNSALRWAPTKDERNMSKKLSRVWIQTESGSLKAVPVNILLSDGIYTAVSGENIAEGMAVITGIAPAGTAIQPASNENAGSPFLPKMKRPKKK